MIKGTITTNWSHESDLNAIFTIIKLTDSNYHREISFCIMQDDKTKDIVSLTVCGDDYRKSSYKNWTVYRDYFNGFINKDNLVEVIYWISYHTIDNSECASWFSYESVCELKYKVIRELSNIIIL